EDNELAAEAEENQAAMQKCEAASAAIGADIADARQRLEGSRSAYVAAETALAEQRRAIQQAERADAEVAKLTEELAADPIPEVRQQLEVAVEARMGCEKTLGAARDTVEQAAGALRQIEEARLEIENKVAPLRERLGELKLKEQAAQINFEQFDTQLREATANEEVLAKAAEDAPRPSSLQGEITKLTNQIGELGAVNLAAVEELRTSTERKGYLDSQATDLEEAVSTLEDAIRK